MTEEGLQLIAKHARMNLLEVLDFSDNHLTDRAMEYLAQAESFANLKTLLLDNNHIGDDGVYALADSPICDGLVELKLKCNELQTLFRHVCAA